MVELRSEGPTHATSPAATPAEPELPPGNHPVEVAARAGFGPMSPMAGEVWHGQATPCVSCGQLARRGQRSCDHCEQNLSPEMLFKMRAYAGPWYVYEHVRPFPGVTFERLVRQIHRGTLNETSIVRGPSTDHQWRFAVETPGLSRYFGRCWNCHHEVTLTDRNCTRCNIPLLIDPLSGAILQSPIAADDRRRTGDGHEARHDRLTTDLLTRELIRATPDWTALKTALDSTPVPQQAPPEEPPRVGRVRATWVAVAMLAIALAALLAIVRMRSSMTERLSPVSPIPAGSIAPQN